MAAVVVVEVTRRRRRRRCGAPSGRATPAPRRRGGRRWSRRPGRRRSRGCRSRTRGRIGRSPRAVPRMSRMASSSSALPASPGRCPRWRRCAQREGPAGPDELLAHRLSHRSARWRRCRRAVPGSPAAHGAGRAGRRRRLAVEQHGRRCRRSPCACCTVGTMYGSVGWSPTCGGVLQAGRADHRRRLAADQHGRGQVQGERRRERHRRAGCGAPGGSGIWWVAHMRRSPCRPSPLPVWHRRLLRPSLSCSSSLIDAGP